MINQAKIKSVIEVQDERGVHYYSLEGVYLGTLGQDKTEPIKEEKTQGAISKPPPPDKVRMDQERENEKLLSVDRVLSKHKS